MQEEQADSVRRRRNRREVEQLVAEYEASGLGRSEFCREHGLALSTLARYRSRWERERRARDGGNPLLAVELCAAPQAPASSAGCTLAVVLTNGRRIEVGCGFDGNTLERLVGVLERA